MAFRSVIISFIVALSLVITGCGKKGSAERSDTSQTSQEQLMQDEAPESVGSVQQTCPVIKGPIDEDIYVDYNDKRVYFCSESCREEFNRDPEKYLKRLKEMGEVAKPLH